MEPNERPPPWYPFRPSDKRIIHFLNLKIQNQPLPMNDIHDVNVFANNETPEIFAGTYNYNEENNEIYFFSNPRQRGKWRAETGTEEVITDNGEVIGYKRRLAYTGNADSPLKWHMQEYMGNEHDPWAVYKLYTTTVKTRIEGNPTGTVSSHTSSDIGSSHSVITGTSRRWPWPAHRRNTRPRIAHVSTTSSSQQALPNAIHSQTSQRSLYSNIVPFAVSSYPSYQNLTGPGSSSSSTLPSFGTPRNPWETQDWNTSLYSAPFPSHHYWPESSFHPQSHQSFQGSTVPFAVPSQTSDQSFRGSTLPFAVPSQTSDQSFQGSTLPFAVLPQTSHQSFQGSTLPFAVPPQTSHQSFQGSTLPFACPSQLTNTLGGSSSDNLWPESSFHPQRQDQIFHPPPSSQPLLPSIQNTWETQDWNTSLPFPAYHYRPESTQQPERQEAIFHPQRTGSSQPVLPFAATPQQSNLPSSSSDQPQSSQLQQNTINPATAVSEPANELLWNQLMAINEPENEQLWQELLQQYMQHPNPNAAEEES